MTERNDEHCCFFCEQPFRAGEMVLQDVTEGLGHRACFGDDREGYVHLDTGASWAACAPLPTGFPYDPAEFTDPAPTEREVSSERVSEEAVWRNLALQFDGHRIDALSKLRFAVRCIEEYANVRDILKLPLSELKAFLAKPPLSGDEVLKQRIELLALRSSVKTVGVKAQDKEALEGAAAFFEELASGAYSAPLVFAQAIRRILSAIEAPPEGEAVAAWLDVSSAPKDGTMLRLLIKPDADAHTSFEDSEEPYETIGFNQFADTQDDEWHFAGWDWSHDCITQGYGTVIGWQLFTHPSPAASSEVAEDRLPTRDEAARAAEVLLRCNGHDLDVWGASDLIDDAPSDALKAITAALKGGK